LSVVEPDTDQLRRMRDWSVEPHICSVKQEGLNSAGGPLELSELFFEAAQPVSHLKGFFDREGDSRKFQQVVANCFSDIKPGFTENAPEPNYVWGIFTGKVHEFHA